MTFERLILHIDIALYICIVPKNNVDTDVISSVYNSQQNLDLGWQIYFALDQHSASHIGSWFCHRANQMLQIKSLSQLKCKFKSSGIYKCLHKHSKHNIIPCL